MTRYSKGTQKDVEKEMKEYKKGRWKSRKQAIAVGLSKARKEGKKVPKKGGSS
jgi:hypothetical protein